MNSESECYRHTDGDGERQGTKHATGLIRTATDRLKHKVEINLQLFYSWLLLLRKIQVIPTEGQQHAGYLTPSLAVELLILASFGQRVQQGIKSMFQL